MGPEVVVVRCGVTLPCAQVVVVLPDEVAAVQFLVQELVVSVLLVVLLVSEVLGQLVVRVVVLVVTLLP